jgi:anti-anti-sigma regulatory factor
MAATATSETVVFRCDHDVLVVTILSESMLSGKALKDFQQQVTQQLGAAKQGVVVECSRLVQGVSSEFLGALVRLRMECVQRRQTVCLCGVRGQLQEAIRVCAFDQVIPVYPNQNEAIKALGSFSEWEKASMASVAQHEASRCRSGATEGWPELLVSRRGKAIVAASLVFFAVTVGGAWSFLSGSPGRPDRMPSRWQQTQPVQLTGRVSYVGRGVTLADTGSAVVAWPARVIPAKKFSVSGKQLFEPGLSPAKETPIGPFVARTDANGRFQMDVRIPPGGACDYYVLALSKNAPARGTIDPGQQAVLDLYFASPSDLLGEYRYDLKRYEVSLGLGVEVDFVLRPVATPR